MCFSSLIGQVPGVRCDHRRHDDAAPPASDDDVVALSVKLMRQQPRSNIRLQYPSDTGKEDMTIELFAGENLRGAMLTREIKLNNRLARRRLPAPPPASRFRRAKRMRFSPFSLLFRRFALVALLAILKIEMTPPSLPGHVHIRRWQPGRFDSGGSGDMGHQEGQILSKKLRWCMACKVVVTA